MDESEVQTITEIYQKLKGRRTAEFDLDIQFDLASFESFRYYTIVRMGPVIAINTGGKPFYLSFLDLVYSEGTKGLYSSSASRESQVWGIAYLKRSYGHMLIRTETFLDKVREMLCHAELKFEEDAAFSSRFFVLANDETLARSVMGPAFRKMISDLEIKDFVIEMIDNMLIIGNNKVIDPDAAEKIVGFLDKVTRLG